MRGFASRSFFFNPFSHDAWGLSRSRSAGMLRVIRVRGGTTVVKNSARGAFSNISVRSSFRQSIPHSTSTGGLASHSPDRARGTMDLNAPLLANSSSEETLPVQNPDPPRVLVMDRTPTREALKNIYHEMHNKPEFYEQVLAIMYRMDLPHPFGPQRPRPTTGCLAPESTVPATIEEEVCSSPTEHGARCQP